MRERRTCSYLAHLHFDADLGNRAVLSHALDEDVIAAPLFPVLVHGTLRAFGYFSRILDKPFHRIVLGKERALRRNVVAH